jgi:DNA polymerase-3 subunit epsilon
MWVAIDVETTGLSPLDGDRVIEIGAIAFGDEGFMYEFSSLVWTDRKISPGALVVHGITSEMLRGQPRPEEVFPSFLRFAGDSTLVAHNARFDLGFIRHELARLGLGLKNRHVCTLKNSRRLLSRLPDYRLETVARHLLGVRSVRGLHRALDDARLVARIWMEMGGYERNK